MRFLVFVFSFLIGVVVLFMFIAYSRPARKASVKIPEVNTYIESCLGKITSNAMLDSIDSCEKLILPENSHIKTRFSVQDHKLRQIVIEYKRQEYIFDVGENHLRPI
jgi:3-phosphoglycerate kinase